MKPENREFMKIFALYFKVKLTKKPEWFDEFVKKYHEYSDFIHITLIQPRYFNENEVENLNNKISEVLKKFTITEEDKKLYFDNLVIGKGSEMEYVFMVNSRENKFLNDIQKELKEALKDYNQYLKEITKEYENNFKPHITVADDLDEEKKKEAEKYFAGDYEIEGVIEGLILPTVKDASFGERTNPNNLKLFRLQFQMEIGTGIVSITTANSGVYGLSPISGTKKDH